MDSIELNFSWQDLFNPAGGGPRKATQARIFLAYPFSSSSGQRLRKALADAADRVGGVEILDGHVADGVAWAPEVRKRIKKSKLVVADLTGPSIEVVFELGFAANKRVVPVVHRKSDVSALPAWITADQVTTHQGTELITTVERILRIAGSRTTSRVREIPAPGHILFIQGEAADWADRYWADLAAMATSAAMPYPPQRITPETLYSPEDIAAYLNAWLVVGCLDGTPADLATHFFVGDTVARDSAGAGPGKGESIGRHAIVLAKSSPAMDRHLADSARRLPQERLTRVTDQHALEHTLAHHIQRYNAFLRVAGASTRSRVTE